MWTKHYKDYPGDTRLKHETVVSGKSITGCEMNEINGWGNTLHFSEVDRKKGRLRKFLQSANEVTDNENS